MNLMKYTYKDWSIDFVIKERKNYFVISVENELNPMSKFLFRGGTKEETLQVLHNWFKGVVNSFVVLDYLIDGFPVYIDTNIFYDATHRPIGFSVVPSTIASDDFAINYSKAPRSISKEGYLLNAVLFNFFILEAHTMEDSKLYAHHFDYKNATVHSQSIRFQKLLTNKNELDIIDDYFSKSLDYSTFIKKKEKYFKNNYLLDEIFIPHKKDILNAQYLGEWKEGRFIPSTTIMYYVKPQFKDMILHLFQRRR